MPPRSGRRTWASAAWSNTCAAATCTGRSSFPRSSIPRRTGPRRLRPLPQSGGSVFFHGHTHVQEAWRQVEGQPASRIDYASSEGGVLQLREGECWLIGVGSVGEPHDGPAPTTPYMTAPPGGSCGASARTPAEGSAGSGGNAGSKGEHSEGTHDCRFCTVPPCPL